MDLAQLLDAIKAHAWPIVAAIVVGFLVRLVKSDKIPIDVPPRFRPLLAVGLGVVSAICEAVIMGTPVVQAAIGGLASAIAAIGGHDVLIEAIFGGKEPSVKASGGVVGGILAAILALSQASGCAAYADEMKKLESGLVVANEAVLALEACSASSVAHSLKACEQLTGDDRVQCVEMVDQASEGVRRVVEAWRHIRCDVLGGLGAECASGEGGGAQ